VASRNIIVFGSGCGADAVRIRVLSARTKRRSIAFEIVQPNFSGSKNATTLVLVVSKVRQLLG